MFEGRAQLRRHALRGTLLLGGLLCRLALPAGAQEPAAGSPHGALPIPCITCHTADGWKPARVDRSFDHGRFGFALRDGHGAVRCGACHASLDFAKVAKACAACHRDVHQAELGLDCAQCHTTRAFEDRSRFLQTHATTRFPLDGAHRALDCAQCHTAHAGQSLAFRGAPTDCLGCHRSDFEGTTSPNHPAAGFSQDCTKCHTATSWATAGFDHNQTDFALTGPHQALSCQACHADKVYNGKPTTCIACHQGDFNGTRNPPHQAAGFALDCTSCHTGSSWSGAVFDHNATRFPLTGEHREASCQDCHGDGVYRGKSTACVSCHQGNFVATSNPPHQAAGFPSDCTLCHSTARWSGAVFNHATTAFPLTGAHQAATCQACHADNVYDGKPATCLSCHLTAYNATTNPPHQAAGFPTDCSSCHSTTTWPGAPFNHSATAFPLTGAHVAATCQACHADNVYDGKPTTCLSCHQTTYTATTNPPHQAAGFPTDCTACHSTTAWPGALFDHNATQFALTGAHRAATCQACHADNVYDGKPITCVSCHQSAYAATRNPPHQAAGFSTDCASCHSTTAWPGATFNHGATGFPLTGAHVAATCQACHGDNVYDGKPTTCVSCHQADYTATTTPSHLSARFPTDCATCHSTVQWQGATFNHDGPYFPIYSGKHLNRWSSCTDCHNNPASYAQFTCLTCHEHNQTKMDDTHSGRPGYSYTSTACYSCHPRP